MYCILQQRQCSQIYSPIMLQPCSSRRYRDSESVVYSQTFPLWPHHISQIITVIIKCPLSQQGSNTIAANHYSLSNYKGEKKPSSHTMLMSLWERHECKLFSGVDCNSSIDQKRPVHIKCFWCQVKQILNTYQALFLVRGKISKNIHNDAPHCGSRATAWGYRLLQCKTYFPLVTLLPMSWRQSWPTSADRWLTVEGHQLIKPTLALGLYKLVHVFGTSLCDCGPTP